MVGASSNVDSPGHDYVRSLVDFGFAGPIYPINPRAPEIMGLKAYPTLSAVPGDVDLVISCIPADGVIAMIGEARAKSVTALHLFTGRFSETGEAKAAELEQEVLSAAVAAGMRIIGPNCMGIYDSTAGLSFRPDLPRERGDVAFISQSGNNSVELMLHGASRGLRFSKVVSYGNALDLTEADFFDYLADDPETKVVGAYIEGTRDGRRLLEALRRCASAKPVVILKGGRTGAGSRTAASHTAALAGQRQIWSAMLRQAGAVEVATFDELIDMMVAFAFLRKEQRAESREQNARAQVGVVGGGGGRAVQSADVCEEAGLSVPKLPVAIREALVTHDELAKDDGDGLAEDRTVGYERMKLSVLAAGIDRLRQGREQCRVETRAGEGRVELLAVHADDAGAESGSEHLLREFAGGCEPEGKQRLEAGGQQ